MAEQAIKLIDSNKELQQLIIHAGRQNSQLETDFSIILTLVHDNIILLVIYPSLLNVGMILYEIEKASEVIKDYLGNNQHFLHEESVL